MSPAMVDIRSPASNSSKLQSNRHRSESSVADRMSSSPSHSVFRSRGILDPSPTMDRWNIGQGVSVSSSAPYPPPPFSSSTASEKLSVPRFRKQRKHSGISRARPAVNAADSGAGQGFNPFVQETSHDAPLDRAEDSGSQAVREQLHSWKPFVPDAPSHSNSGTGFVFGSGSSRSIASSSNIVSESVKVYAFDLDNNSSGSTGSGIFVFGSGIEKGSSLSRNSSQSSSAQSLASVESSKTEDNRYSDTGAFVFGSRAKKDGHSHHNSSLESDNNSFNGLNKKLGNEKNGQLDSGFFMYNDGEMKSTHASKNSSFTFGDGLLREQTERSRKIDQNSSDVDVQKSGSGVFISGSCTETKANLDHVSSMLSDESLVFSLSKLPEDLRKLKIEASKKGKNVSKDPGIFIFGSDINKSTRASKSSSFGAFDSSFSNLPEKMEKLNLFSSAYAVHGEIKTADFVSESSLKQAQFVQASAGLDEGGFSKFSGELKNQNLQRSGNDDNGNGNPGVFVFGSDVQRKANSGKSSSLSFDESSISKLPDEIGKMKLSSLGNEDDSQKKSGNTYNQHDSNFAFVSSNFTSQSVNVDYGSRVTPLQAYNSCGLSSETTSLSPVPCFQSSGADFYSTSIHTGSDTPRMEFRSQKQDTSMLTKENLFTEPHKNKTSGMKKEDFKSLRSKIKRGKSKQSSKIHSGTTKEFVHGDMGLEENEELDSTGGYSPMDYSPYQETLVSNQCSREASVVSDESVHFDSRCTSNDARRSGSDDGKEEELFSCSANGKEERLLSAVDHFSANEGLPENKASNCDLKFSSPSHFTSEYFWVDEKLPGLGKENLAAKDEIFGSGILNKSSSMESESFSYVSSVKQTTYEGTSGFTFNSNLEDAAQSNILFATTSSVQGPSSASRRIYRRKSRVKGGQDSHPNTKVHLASPSNLFLFPDAHVPSGPKQERKGCDDGGRAGKVNATKTIEESATIAATSIKAEEACEKWRLRGNQAYADGNLSKAEDYYSHGVDSFPLKEYSKIRSRALMLCFSNRAATRMSLGRLREALSDCKMAVTIDPSFLRARVRAGNILLSLGEPADALQHFEKVLQLDKESKSDQKILLEAVDGLQKTQKLNDLMDQSSMFLKKRTPDDATKALQIISEALSFSPYSEILLEMKAEALVLLRNFEEAIQICEQTLELAEKNAVTDSGCQLKDDDHSKSLERSCTKLWRWRVISKSYFYLGKLEEANELLQKHENVKPVIDKYWSRYPESSASFSATVCELLRLKTAGNEAFQAGKHLEAVELYTAALALNTESRPFTAICFCNRAAAFQALGQITDAIADCSLAIALDSSYRKAISRRATLHEMIRDYGQAATDLLKLTSLLEMSSEDKCSGSGTLDRSSSNTNDLNQARMRLGIVEEEARKGGTLDLYMILGVERSCSAADVRKAYRKAALRHHPDKAGQFLARSENGDDRVWREVAEEVHTNADRLFKMIGEAYTILLDPSKRLQYDTEVESRTMKKGCGTYGGNSSTRTPASSHNCQSERSTDPRHWRSYGNTHRRSSESSWSNR